MGKRGEPRPNDSPPSPPKLETTEGRFELAQVVTPTVWGHHTRTPLARGGPPKAGGGPGAQGSVAR